MVNKNAAATLAGILNLSKTFIKQIETGDGLGIPDDKKDEFQKLCKEKGVPDVLKDLKTKMKEFEKTAKNMSGAKP